MISIEYVPVDVQIETEILDTVMGQTQTYSDRICPASVARSRTKRRVGSCRISLIIVVVTITNILHGSIASATSTKSRLARVKLD